MAASLPVGKVVGLPELLERLAGARAEGRRVVFTNGAFDLLHVGHVRYLQAARALGDVLVVGLNSDASVRLNKEPGRPVVPGPERAEILAALQAVDFVVLFDERTAAELISAIRPDVYVKGGDYTLETLPEAPLVQAYGGRVVLIPFVEGRSTSGLIQEIVRRFGAGRASCEPNARARRTGPAP